MVFHIILILIILVLPTEYLRAPSARRGAPMDPSRVRGLTYRCEGRISRRRCCIWKRMDCAQLVDFCLRTRTHSQVRNMFHNFRTNPRGFVRKICGRPLCRLWTPTTENRGILQIRVSYPCHVPYVRGSGDSLCLNSLVVCADMAMAYMYRCIQ